MSRPFKALAALLILSAAIGFAREVNAFGLGRLGAGFGKLGAMGEGGSVSPPPTGCLGVIDASAGCPLPMLGS